MAERKQPAIPSYAELCDQVANLESRLTQYEEFGPCGHQKSFGKFELWEEPPRKWNCTLCEEKRLEVAAKLTELADMYEYDIVSPVTATSVARTLLIGIPTADRDALAERERKARLEAAERCLKILNEAVETGGLRKHLEAYVEELRSEKEPSR